MLNLDERLPKYYVLKLADKTRAAHNQRVPQFSIQTLIQPVSPYLGPHPQPHHLSCSLSLQQKPSLSSAVKTIRSIPV